MYIPSSMFGPPTPSATSHASTATAKQSGSKVVEPEPERGRSLSRSSSTSSSSSAVMLLSPDSVDSATLPGYFQGTFTYPAPQAAVGQPSSTTYPSDFAAFNKELQSHLNPVPSQKDVVSMKPISQEWQGYLAGTPGLSFANHSQMPSTRASSIPSYPAGMAATAVPYGYPYPPWGHPASQPPTTHPAQPPMLAKPAQPWPTWQPGPPLDPQLLTPSLPESPGLFGPRTPREHRYEVSEGSPGLFGPRSPSPGRYYTESELYQVPPGVPQPGLFGPHTPVQYCETESTVSNTPRPLSTVSEATEPLSLSPVKLRTAAAASSSPTDLRGHSVATPVVITIPSRTVSRASSAQSYSPQPAVPVQAIPANRTRGRSPGSTHRTRSRSVSSWYDAGAVSYDPTVVIRTRSRSSSRSRSRTPHVVIERSSRVQVNYGRVPPQALSPSASSFGSRSPSGSPQILRQLPPPTARTGSHRSSRTRSVSPGPYPPGMTPRVVYERSRSRSPSTIGTLHSRSRRPVVVQPARSRSRGRSRTRSPRPVINIVPASPRDSHYFSQPSGQRYGSPSRSFGAPSARVSYAVPQMSKAHRSNRAPNQRSVHHAHRPLSPSTASSTSSADMPPRVVTGMTPPPAAAASMFLPPVGTQPIPNTFPYVHPIGSSAAPYMSQAGLGYMPYMDSYVESPLWTPVGFGRPAHAQEAWAWPAGEPYYSPVRHPRFWFEDGNLAIRVENTLYNLHRYLFAKSSTFSAYQYQLGGTRELKENKTDFDRLLSILYPTDYGSHQCKTTEEWTSVLLLANKWGMWDIRRLAISQLSICAGPVDKIALGHRYNVQEWLGPAYMELTMRGQAISAEEGAKLGVDAMVRLGALKDEVFGNLPAFVDEDKFSDLFAQKLYV